MHGWGAVDFRSCLAPIIIVTKYQHRAMIFYLHLAQLYILDVTLSHIGPLGIMQEKLNEPIDNIFPESASSLP